MIQKATNITVHGEIDRLGYLEYYENVKRDFIELKDQYPFSSLLFTPTIKPEKAEIKMIAAHKDIIKETCAEKNDFLGAYSKELYIVIPFNYTKVGCDIFGAKWLDKSKLKPQDIHFYTGSLFKERGYKFCVGVPKSFLKMSNVILENVRTVDYMLVAYKNIMLGYSNRLDLKTYSHGEEGEKEYLQDRSRYIK